MHSLSRQYILPWAWACNVLAIFVLCIWGRQLQHWVQASIPLAWIGLFVTVFLAVAVGFLILRQAKAGFGPGTAVAGFLAAAILILTFDMERPEEKLHLLLFGALGLISIRLFGFWKGLGICLALAGADELLQLQLPSRVGDFRDVGMNSVAGICGALIGRFTLPHPRIHANKSGQSFGSTNHTNTRE